MKKIKTFNSFINENENTNELSLKLVKLALQNLEEGSVSLESIDEKNDRITFQLVDCGIEPEVGSYTHRTDINGTIYRKDGKYELEYDLISGQYGSDEEENDDYEVELDYQIGHSSEDGTKTFGELEELTNFIEELLNDHS